MKKVTTQQVLDILFKMNLGVQIYHTVQTELAKIPEEVTAEVAEKES